MKHLKIERTMEALAEVNAALDAYGRLHRVAREMFDLLEAGLPVTAGDGDLVERLRIALQACRDQDLEPGRMPETEDERYSRAVQAKAWASLSDKSRAEVLSIRFEHEVTAEMSEAGLLAIRLRNGHRNDPGACATHDFRDANMTMWRAWDAVTGGLDHDPGSDADTAIWNAAWTHAMPFLTWDPAREGEPLPAPKSQRWVEIENAALDDDIPF